MCHLQPQRVGEDLDAGLRRVVRRQPRSRRVRRQRGHDQHVAPALDHSRQRGPQGVEDAALGRSTSARTEALDKR